MQQYYLAYAIIWIATKRSEGKAATKGSNEGNEAKARQGTTKRRQRSEGKATKRRQGSNEGNETTKGSIGQGKATKGSNGQRRGNEGARQGRAATGRAGQATKGKNLSLMKQFCALICPLPVSICWLCKPRKKPSEKKGEVFFFEFNTLSIYWYSLAWFRMPWHAVCLGIGATYNKQRRAQHSEAGNGQG